MRMSDEILHLSFCRSASNIDSWLSVTKQDFSHLLWINKPEIYREIFLVFSGV
jgi:hypothetical protein